ncbi:glycosyltransferase family 2 protein [Mycoplasmopsis alligatoris]|uniref:Glycosyltransferase, group 2 family protein n=1 Tax=Mycoplasmopsis alligatoris A21JP2 TaxID=747682 RepID=D4XW29_9BACT|nr:glycosyltransferase family 2 protein [Mycoplasmopsis alligatoris]EFF41446.1 glycosyltransferase, group 2 family protein [Mycoplasmopsis alligatoris A21JP2]
MKKTPYNPLISILIPTYNAEKFIEKTFQKNLNQSYKNIEYIFHDDCSTDKTFELLEQAKNIDSRVKIIKSNSNSGLPNARKNLLNAAKGDFVFFLDDDDFLTSKKVIAKCVKKLNPDLEILSTQFNYNIKLSFVKFWVKNMVRNFKKIDNALKYYSENSIYTWGHFFNLNFIKQFHLTSERILYEDVLENGHIFASCKKFKSYKISTILYNRRPNSLSAFDKKYKDKLHLLIDAYSKNIKKLKNDFLAYDIDEKLQKKVIQNVFMECVLVISLWYLRIKTKKQKKVFKEFIHNQIYPEILKLFPSQKIVYKKLYYFPIFLSKSLFSKN